MPQKFSKNLGFTLPEMLVAFLLFSIIMGTTTGIFVSGFRSWRRVSSFLNVQNNVRFAIESISRELRTGADYQILRGGGSSMTSGMGMGENGDVLSFVNQKGIPVRYRLRQGGIEKSMGGGAYQLITAENVIVDNFRFNLVGGAFGDGGQPKITLLFKIRSGVGAHQTELWVQTTVTQRQLDS